jgi:hypothetical protein
MKLSLPLFVIVSAAVALGQATADGTKAGKAKAPDAPKASSSPASPTGVSIGLPFYAVDDAMRLKTRDLEYKSDQLEIEIQRMKVKIEEDKAAEAAIWKEIASAAAKYAQDHTIDPDRNDFDAAEVKYVQKKNVPLIPAPLMPEKEKGTK